MIRNTFKKTINYFGYDIINRKRGRPEMTMRAALERCRKRGTKLNTVIDVGASNGCWSKMCMDFYPEAEYLLIEALPDHKNSLEKFVSTNKNSRFILKAAGRNQGNACFHKISLTGGGVTAKNSDENCIVVPETTVDYETEAMSLEPPYLLKLDTHGYEIPILEGAKKTLAHTVLLVIEAYNYCLNAESLRYFELSEYLNRLGFISVEIVDLELEQKNNTLWQMYIFFVKNK